MSFHDEVGSQIKSRYPDLGASDEELNKICRITTPHNLTLSKSILEDAKRFVSSVFKMRCSKDYLSQFSTFDPGNFSVLMAYDFHVTADNQLKLIEINTNGASSLLVDILFQMNGHEDISRNFQKSIKESFLNEFQKTSGKVNIIDYKYKEQNSYVEFLMFKKLFQIWGFQTELCNPEDFESADFIYNRLTDFYLAEPYSKKIKEAYLSRKTIVTPNPHEYDLLANKLRLKIFSESTSPVAQFVPTVKPFTDFKTAEELWSERKKYFFKPIESYGSRGAFKGESISRKLFNEIFTKNYIAQEYVKPPIWNEYKWDLRFYAYKDEIQLTAARLYKGQTTNFQEEGSGIATVTFS